MNARVSAIDILVLLDDVGEYALMRDYLSLSQASIQSSTGDGWQSPCGIGRHFRRRNSFSWTPACFPICPYRATSTWWGMLAGIKAKADEMGAKQIVFDSIDVLLSLLDNAVAERRELYRVRDWLSDTGLTGLLTFKTDSEENIPERYGFVQFMADCVVVLYHRLKDRISLREARIRKYRSSSFSENEFPMVIGGRGIEIADIGLSESD
jgi:KaiC